MESDEDGDIFKSGFSVPLMYDLVSLERTEVKTGVLLYMYSPEINFPCKHCLKLTIACIYAAGVSSVHDTGGGILAEWVDENMPMSDTISLVVRCAFRLRDICNIQLRKNHPMQRIQIVISAGRFSRVNRGEHRCCVATGPAVEAIRSVEASLESGNIILSPEAWQLCDKEQLTVTYSEDERAIKVQHISELRRVTRKDINLYYMTIPAISDLCRIYLITNVDREKIVCKFNELTALNKMETEEPPPEPQSGFHGVLTYRRESDWTENIMLPQTATDHSVWCEFCGEKAKPPLDFSKTSNPEDFCCAWYMELFKNMKQHWRSLQEPAGELSYEDDFDINQQRSRARAQTIFQRSQRIAAERLRKAKRGELRSDLVENETAGCTVTSCDKYTTITFRLSEYVRWKRSVSEGEENLRLSEHLSTTSSVPAGFGLCRYQKGFMQKFYSDGKTFLIALPDGTAQVYYPSGNLAIIAFKGDAHGVCIVLDEIISNCPIRAYFTSNGDAFCYHSNRNTWLHMDEWGGQRLNEDGSKKRNWKWTAPTDNPIPFNPIYLSLNKNIGVRVQGRESVFVTFLGSGQQARFSVGLTTKPGEPAPGEPALCEDELMPNVTQLNSRLALEHLRCCLESHSEIEGQAFRLPRFLVSQGRKLLRLSWRKKTNDEGE